jgi:methionyl-tRNA synthetase
VLYDLGEGLRWIAVLLHPVMPERMSEMWEQLGAPGRIDEDWSSSLHKWGGLAPLTQTALAAPLFPKLDAVVTS